MRYSSVGAAAFGAGAGAVAAVAVAVGLGFDGLPGGRLAGAGCDEA